MGRNAKKCTLYLYNIPHNVTVPIFTSIAWSYEGQGPFQGAIDTVIMRRNEQGQLLCYDVPDKLLKDMPQNIQKILSPYRYLGITTNAQMDSNIGNAKLIQKMAQRIGLVAKNTHSIQEAKILHNMSVCQVATYSPLCASMTLQECKKIDKSLINAYQHRMRFMSYDAKHSIFISSKKGGIGVRCFTREYIGSLLRDTEVYISNDECFTSHAVRASIEAATKQNIWQLHQNKRIPGDTLAATRAENIYISGKLIHQYLDNAEHVHETEIVYNHMHTMERAICTTSLLGFILRNLDYELCSRITDELMLKNKLAKAIGDPTITNRASLSAYVGDGNRHFYKYSMLGHFYLLIQVIIEEAL
jgi:hypothetical protein